MPPPDTSFRSLLELLSGHAVVRSLGVVAELGVADALVEGPLDAAELAQRCSANKDALGRVMRMLAAVGVFTESSKPPRYGLTPISELLRTDAKNSLRDFARLRGGGMSWGAWTGLEHAVRTGESGFERIHGSSPFDHFRQDPAAARNFDDGVRSLSRRTDASVVESYDFSRFRKVIDVGGGRGGFLAAVLRAHPHLRGILLDMATPLAESGEVLKNAGVADRCEVVVGDFFQALPKGADVAVLSHVIHNWGDDDAVRLLRNCRDAVGPRNTVLILEYGLTDDAAGLIAKQFDLQMLVYFGSGRERTAEEYRELVTRAGMTLTKIVPTSSPMAVIEAVTKAEG
jgi:ubiquinone/menaquinone biosynthesis C-methylase UbiE